MWEIDDSVGDADVCYNRAMTHALGTTDSYGHHVDHVYEMDGNLHS